MHEPILTNRPKGSHSGARYFIKEGRVSEAGTHDQLLAKRGHYYKYVQLQGLHTPNIGEQRSGHPENIQHNATCRRRAEPSVNKPEISSS